MGLLSDKELVKQALSGAVNTLATQMTTTPLQTAPYQIVEQVFTDIYEAWCTDGGTAATNQTETAFATVRDARRVKAIKVQAPIAVASNGSNFVTFTVLKRTAGGSSTSLGTFATSATSMVAFAPATFTLANPLPDLAAGDTLTMTATKSGTGVAIAAATSQVYVQVECEAI